MTGPAIIALTPGGLATARRIAPLLAGARVHGRAGRAEPADEAFADTGVHLAALFVAGRPIVGVCAAGILIRMLAPHLEDKHAEPPVVAVAEDGSAVVPLLGGHHGANDLARTIAAVFGISPAITTASDVALGVALDAPPDGYRLANPEHAGDVARRLLAGEPVRVVGDAPWLDGARLALDRRLGHPHPGPPPSREAVQHGTSSKLPPESADRVSLPSMGRGQGWGDSLSAGDGVREAILAIEVTDLATDPGANRLVYHSATLAVGVGAERGADPEAVVALVRQALAEAGLAPASVALVASLDLKEDEPAVEAVAAALDRPARFFTAARLEAETGRLANPSEAVYRAVGCHGVAEAAALAAAGPHSELMVAKRIGDRVTCAIARAAAPIDPEAVGRARGHLAIVGLGPGCEAMRTAEAASALAGADDLVGYRLYLDLAGPLRGGQARHDFALGEEEARVAHALTLASQGRRVALVSSGDPGIYAMAALAFELIERGAPEWRRVAVTVLPGISALQAAAARAGAPLGHDFCAISLSDLLTPAAIIERRLEAAADGDFVVALYNPASGRRRALLDRAIAILGRRRPAATPVVVARNLGRPDERVTATTIGALDPAAIDMLTVVLIGSSTTRIAPRRDGGAWVYTPRGYAVGTRIGAGDAA